MFNRLIRSTTLAPTMRASFMPKAFSTYKPLLNEAQQSTFGSALSQKNNNIIHGQSKQSNSNKSVKKIRNMKTLKHVLHCRFRKNNTYITLNKVEMDLNYEANHPELTYNEKVLYYLTLPQKVLVSQSTGCLGFRKSQRGEYEATFQLASHIFKFIREKELFKDGGNLELVVREYGKGRKAFFDAMKGKEGSGIREYITRMSDYTPVKFGGVKSPKPRRI
ncbi:hypothetical protein CANARDRAFT_28485 [[Candida] arabinofermentans NRRL YB-2248]|uniref:Small ribosomal subunit protein uS11m n=1 Tax=[Candida] arabinofermentans NRRL YB-2248 TaxID=983967 RepID=A0A1E4T0G0_9ASCO|nr:hypothetical protein CANARDRAFT_28485 [[Candida] arabinofermentans NRRL YB-2248]